MNVWCCYASTAVITITSSCCTFDVIFLRDMNLDSDDSFDELIAEGCKARELLLSSKKSKFFSV